jgi:endoglucanase
MQSTKYGIAFLRYVLGILIICQASFLDAALLVDDCEGTTPHLAEGWVSYDDGHSVASPSPFAFSSGGYESEHCATLSFEMKTGVLYPFCGMLIYFKPANLTDYEGIRFRVKGAGGWSVQIATSATDEQKNHYSAPLLFSKEWSLVEVPFSILAQTWGNKKPWAQSLVNGVQWSASGYAGDKGWISVDNIEFYKKSEKFLADRIRNPILREPKVNQVGYLPESRKYFAITESDGVSKKGDAFAIFDKSGKSVYAGKIKSDSIDDKPSTGEKVFLVDFSALTQPGIYSVEVNGARSASFKIGFDVYMPVFKDALRSFYIIRCGTQIDDSVSGIKHKACHMQDALDKATGKARELTGGWHNADDYGKWVLEEAVSCSWMLWLYELRQADMEGLSIAIPESANKISDLLDSAKWGLDWMLKMQNPDGSVLHKVDAEDHFCPGTHPEDDPYPRYLKKPGSIDAADFTGTMCLASRAFRSADSLYADKCLEAAKKAWEWLEANPGVTDRDGDYVDLDPSQEKLWALGEMARTTGDDRLVGRFGKEATPDKIRQVGWMEPQFFGYMAMSTNPKTPAKMKEALQNAIAAFCDSLVSKSQSNGYGVALDATEYFWESNENLLSKTNALLFGYALIGNEKYREAALRQMNWLLGANSLGFSFVAGYGDRSVAHPYHWTMTAYNKLIPGWVSGGPNQYSEGADQLLCALIKSGTPPAKCYVDSANALGSWASNEGETSETAALVFAAGFLSVNME